MQTPWTTAKSRTLFPKGSGMTPLDQALKALYDDPESLENRHHFYSLFLQTDFQVPTFDQEAGEVARAGEPAQPDQALPLIMESDGVNFMMLFDQAERVTAWADEEVQCISMPGYVAIAMATEGLYLALNVGTAHAKQFVPEEIAWLKKIVEQSTGANAEG
jgi:SseB protein N-terminal domain